MALNSHSETIVDRKAIGIEEGSKRFEFAAFFILSIAVKPLLQQVSFGSA